MQGRLFEVRVRGVPRRLRFPWRTAWQIHREVDEELQFHLDYRIADLEAEGCSPEEARRRALLEFGDPEIVFILWAESEKFNQWTQAS